MAIKRKEIVNIISYEKVNVTNQKEESDKSSQIKIEIIQFRNIYFILLIAYLFLSSLYINKFHLNRSLNIYGFKALILLSLNFYRNRISGSNILSQFLELFDMDIYYLYFSRINQFLFVFKLINTFEKNLMNYSFDEFLLDNSLFHLLLNDILLILNMIKSRNEELNYYLYSREKLKNDLVDYKNDIFLVKIIIINTRELNYAKRIKSDNNITVTNINFTNKNYDTENINFSDNLFIKYKFLLEKNSFTIINQYIKISIIKFYFFNIATDKKINIFTPSFYFKRKFNSDTDICNYFIIKYNFVLMNNMRDEYKQTLEFFLVIKILRKNSPYKSFKLTITHSIIYQNNIIFILYKEKIQATESKDTAIIDIKNIQNIYIKLENSDKNDLDFLLNAH